MARQLWQVGLPRATRAPDGADWQGCTVRAWGGGTSRQKVHLWVGNEQGSRW